MKRIRLAAGFTSLAVGTLLLTGTSRSSAAQDQQAYPHHGTGRSEDKGQTGAFVKAVREATERFRDVAVAQSEGYALMFGCVSGPDTGAMGLHYVNLALVGDGELDVARPEIVIYEPLPNGRLRLTGADYLVFSSDWHARNAGNA